MFFGSKPEPQMVQESQALPGRNVSPAQLSGTHTVLGTPITGPQPSGTEEIYLGMGCFWGAERIFWQLDGVVTTAVGYQGGFTPHPTYEEVCTGRTGHAEVVAVVYDPQRITPEQILKEFWENHDPTTANRQGNDVGTQYRSAIYWTTAEQHAAALATREAFQGVLSAAGHGAISTEVRPAPLLDGSVPADVNEVLKTAAAGGGAVGPFYYAEEYHQQYLDKNPGGYCNHGPNGFSCPVGLVRQDEVPAQRDVLPPVTELS